MEFRLSLIRNSYVLRLISITFLCHSLDRTYPKFAKCRRRPVLVSCDGLFPRRLLRATLLRAKTVALRPNSDDDIQHRRALISLNNCYMDVDDNQVDIYTTRPVLFVLTIYLLLSFFSSISQEALMRLRKDFSISFGLLTNLSQFSSLSC